MRVYMYGDDGVRTFVHGPADLRLSSREIHVHGEASERDAIRWSTVLGLAVAAGAGVRRFP